MESLMLAPRTEDPDAGLFSRWRQARDGDALGALVERHWARVYRLAWRIVRDPALAEDVAQETFVKAAFGRGYREEGRFGAWLARIAANEARNAVIAASRRERRERATPVDAAAAAADLGGRPPEERELLEALDAHLERLPDDLRVPLVLRYAEGYTHEEVADALGLPSGTASSRIRRGLERLRESLSSAGHAAAVPGLARLEALLAGAGAAAAPAVPAAPTVPSLLAAGAAAAGAATSAGSAGPAGAGTAASPLALKLVALAAVLVAAAGAGFLAWVEPPPASDARPASTPPEVSVSRSPEASPSSKGPEASVSRSVDGGSTAGRKGSGDAGGRGAVMDGSGAAPVAGDAPASAAPASAAGAPAGAEARRHSIRGRVEDRDGRPLAAIRVRRADEAGYHDTATGAEGAFEVASPLPLEGEELWVFDPARRHAPWKGPAAPGMVVTLETGAAIAVRVVERGSGAPIEGARVRLVGVWWGEDLFAPPDGKGGRPSTTDEAGLCDLGGLRAGEYVIAVHAPDRTAAHARVHAAAGARREVTLELGAGATVAGRVLGPDGRPVAGAAVSDAAGIVLARGDATLDPDAVLGWMAERGLEVDSARAGAGILEAVVHEVRRTGADGRFVLGRVAPGTREIRAFAPEHGAASAVVEVPADGARVEVTIVLAAGGAVEGRVETGGRPGVVSVTSAPGQVSRLADVGTDGTYRVAGLRPGTYAVLLSVEGPDGFAPDFSTLKLATVRAGETVRCDLGAAGARGARVAGPVRIGGEPLGEGQVMAFAAKRPDETFRMSGLSTDGRYTLEDVAPGSHVIYVVGVGHRLLEVPAGAREVRLDIDFPALAIRGRVVDASGRPIAGVEVEAVRADLAGDPDLSTLTANAETGPDGEFELVGLDSGEYRGEAAKEGFVAASFGPVAAGDPGPLRLVLRPGGTIRASLIGPQGEPIADPYIAVFDAESGEVAGHAPLTIWLGRAGSEATGVPPGTYTVIAGSWRGSFARKTGVRFEGGELTVELALGPGGDLDLRARDRASGEPLAGARVDLRFADGGRLPFGDFEETLVPRTDAGGAARLERLAAGGYRGRVVLEGGREAAFELAIRDGETTTVEVAVP